MRFVWISALKDLRRLRRDPLALVMWVGIPVLVSLILLLVFGRGGGTPPQGRLLLADQDETFLSLLLSGGFSQGPLSKMVVIEKVAPDEGQRRMDRGDASALLIIPKGFGQALLLQEPCRLRLITNPSQRILPGIIEESLSMMVEGAFYIQALAGDQLRVFTGTSPSDQTIAQTSVAFRRLGDSIRSYLDPPLIKLETKVIEESSVARVNFATLFFPGMLLMALMFIGSGLVGDLWKERNQGALRRLAMTPGRLQEFLAGKVLAVAIVLGVIGTVALSAAHWVLDMPVANHPAALLWIGTAGLALYFLAMLLQICASSERTAHVLVNMFLIPFAMMGGSFFPFEIMPAWMAAIGRLTPNGWVLLQLKKVLDGSMDPPQLAVRIGVVILGCALAFLLAMRRLRRAFLT